jgi:hydrogenase maturation factor HypF (carbamoyltransferase family)
MRCPQCGKRYLDRINKNYIKTENMCKTCHIQANDYAVQRAYDEYRDQMSEVINATTSQDLIGEEFLEA